MAGFIWGNAVASATTTKGTGTFVVVLLSRLSIVSIYNIWTVKPALRVTD